MKKDNGSITVSVAEEFAQAALKLHLLVTLVFLLFTKSE
jgi:hypothetical protein